MNAPLSHSFAFSFLDQPCAVELHGADPDAARPFHRYLELFPFFGRADGAAPRFTVRIHDISRAPAELAPGDPIFAAMREHLQSGYTGLNAELVDLVCSPAFVRNRAAREQVQRIIEDGGAGGLSLQKDFLVCSDRAEGVVDAYADVPSSLKEAWPFHVLNFFKIFFFAMGAVRLHGSGAVANDRALLLLANTGGGKSTMKEFFLRDTPDVRPFTDDSIMALRTQQGFSLYQDPVEFMRWVLMPDAALADHVIPEPQAPIIIAPAIDYLVKGDLTQREACEGEQIFDLVNEEAFFQQGFLTQRFIPQPDGETYLQKYFQNTRDLFAGCSCHVVTVKHHDDYRELFGQWRKELGIER